MQKRLIPFLSVLALVAILYTSCSKDDDPPAAKTKTELITKAAWKYEKIDPAAAQSQIECFIDNITTFTADGKGTCPDTGDQCNPPTGNFNWNFTDSESKLHLDATLIPSGSGDFTIVKLDEINLVLSQNIDSPIGQVLVTITFKH
jgi:hypothetical protein